MIVLNSKAKRKPGKTRPATSPSTIQGLCSETPPKKSLQNKTLCLDKPTRLTHRGFRDADFFGASPVASALDRCIGRDPDTLSPHPSMTTYRPAMGTTGTRISLKERTCRIYARQVKQNWIREMHRQKDKTGGVVDRPRQESSFSGLPSAKFFDKNNEKFPVRKKRQRRKETAAPWNLTPQARFRGIVCTSNLSSRAEFNGQF
jgi:hypothetical protein